MLNEDLILITIKGFINMSITASDVKELRSRTGAGMMDCKKALNETAGNIEEAAEWLRKNGIAKAAKKSGRIATDGVVAIKCNEERTKAVLLELNCETDFVARHEDFLALKSAVMNAAFDLGEDLTAESLSQYKLADGKTIQELVVESTATIGEKIDIRRFEVLTGACIGAYTHSNNKFMFGCRLK